MQIIEKVLKETCGDDPVDQKAVLVAKTKENWDEVFKELYQRSSEKELASFFANHHPTQSKKFLDEKLSILNKCE